MTINPIKTHVTADDEQFSIMVWDIKQLLHIVNYLMKFGYKDCRVDYESGLGGTAGIGFTKSIKAMVDAIARGEGMAIKIKQFMRYDWQVFPADKHRLGISFDMFKEMFGWYEPNELLTWNGMTINYIGPTEKNGQQMHCIHAHGSTQLITNLYPID